MIINEQPAFLLLRKQVETFTNITDVDWEMLLPFLELKQLRKNELFIKEGKRANEIGLVINGMFRQYYTKDGEEKPPTFFLSNILSALTLVALPVSLPW